VASPIYFSSLSQEKRFIPEEPIEPEKFERFLELFKIDGLSDKTD
jgi:hypothetical protein